MNVKGTKYLRRILKMGAAAALALAPLGAAAQDRVNVPLTDPTRPASIRVSVLSGSITIKGADVKEIAVEARVRPEEERERKGSGMKRIQIATTGLSVEEENNSVRIGADSHQRTVDLTITVPRQCSLRLRSTNDGDIIVSNIEGELDVNNTNGPVTLTGISGSVIAHALNEDIKVTFNRLAPGKPMAFSSLNGNIDVTFPADFKANVSIKSDNGDVYSDFDVALVAAPAQPIVQDSPRKGGKFQVKIEKTVRGTINGGGPEFQFTNFNGDIFIRKVGASAAKD